MVSSSDLIVQYNFLKAEAELPGIVSQFTKMLIGGLLRKKPALKLPEGLPSSAEEWIASNFHRKGGSLVGFLNDLLEEEVVTSASWIYVDHPYVEPDTDYSAEELAEFKPYPVIWDAESVINVVVDEEDTGPSRLKRVIVKGTTTAELEEDEFHAKVIDTVWVHELHQGNYRIREFRCDEDGEYQLYDTFEEFYRGKERLKQIPAWPANGTAMPKEPLMAGLVDKEVALYNKVTRRNHLLYSASTYTPVIFSDMGDDAFADLVASGLGSWLHMGVNDKVSVLETPTAALKDMAGAIASAIEDLAKLGIRMMSPETAQAGVALEIRNASQTAQLGTMNTKISATMTSVIKFMLEWHYLVDVEASEIDFQLSSDFKPLPAGVEWLTLLTDWYNEGLIPRSVWLMALKHNDMVAADYDDDEGIKEMTDDGFMKLKSKKEQDEAKDYLKDKV